MFAGERVRVHGTFFEVGVVCQYLVDATKKRLGAEVMGSVRMERAVDVDCYFLGSLPARFLTYLRFRRAIRKLLDEGIIVERMWRF